MENFYTAYSKTINGVTFHFVKQFQTFPEYKNVSPFLENYGMHTNFYKACKIARIEDKTIQQQLLDLVANTTIDAKIIQIDRGTTYSYNYKSRLMNLPGLLSRIGLRRLLNLKESVA